MSVEKVHGDVQPNESLSPDYRSGKAVGYATSSGSRESEEESVDLYQTSDDRRQIGLVSAIFLYVLSALFLLVAPANALRLEFSIGWLAPVYFPRPAASSR